MTTLQEEGTWQLTDKDGERVKVQLRGQLERQALHFQEGNERFHTMKLIAKERKMIFTSKSRNEQTYEALKEQRVKLPPLQFYQ